MRKIGIVHIDDERLTQYRRTVTENGSKVLKIYKPKPNVFISHVPDNRDSILQKMKEEMNKKLEVRIPERRI